jgi:Ca2+:H+ antiporter
MIDECRMDAASPPVVIAALPVFALIVPNYTETSPDPVTSPGKTVLFIVITLFYAVFVIIQTMRHRAFFAKPEDNRENNAHEGDALGGLLIAVLVLACTPAPNNGAPP